MISLAWHKDLKQVITASLAHIIPVSHSTWHVYDLTVKSGGGGVTGEKAARSFVSVTPRDILTSTAEFVATKTGILRQIVIFS